MRNSKIRISSAINKEVICELDFFNATRVTLEGVEYDIELLPSTSSYTALLAQRLYLDRVDYGDAHLSTVLSDLIGKCQEKGVANLPLCIPDKFSEEAIVPVLSLTHTSVYTILLNIANLVDHDVFFGDDTIDLLPKRIASD